MDHINILLAAAASVAIGLRVYHHLTLENHALEQHLADATANSTSRNRGRASRHASTNTYSNPDTSSSDEDTQEYQRHHQGPSRRRTRYRKSALPAGNDFLSLEALAQLTKCDNVNLQESALQLLLDRAMSNEHLSTIIAACGPENHPQTRLKGVATIQQLAKSEPNRDTLVRAGIVKILSDLLAVEDEDESTIRYALVALFRLVSNKEPLKFQLVEYKILDVLLRLLTATPTHSNDIKYWALLLLHQLSLQEELHEVLLSKKVIRILAKMTRLTFGNSNMQKLCLHSLVRLISSLEKNNAVNELDDLVAMNMVPLICACIRNDDLELSSWAAFVLHEFVTRDVAREQFAASKGLAKALASMLAGGEESCIPRVTLRSLKCLSLNNDQFQADILRAGIMKKVLGCLSATDEDTRYWALAVLHDLIGMAESHEEFLANKGLEALIDRVASANTHESLYIADIFVCLCSSVKTHKALEASNMTQAVMVLARSNEFDLQYAGIALLLNLATIGDNMITSILEAGGIELMMSTMLDVTKEPLQTIAAKTLTTIARKMPTLRRYIIGVAIRPLVTRILFTGPKCVVHVFRKFGQNEDSYLAQLTTVASTAIGKNSHHSIIVQPDKIDDDSNGQAGLNGRSAPGSIRRLSVMVGSPVYYNTQTTSSPLSAGSASQATAASSLRLHSGVPSSATSTQNSAPLSPDPTGSHTSSIVSYVSPNDEWNAATLSLASHIEALLVFLTHSVFDNIDASVGHQYFDDDDDLQGVEDAISFQMEALITLMVDLVVVFAIIPSRPNIETCGSKTVTGGHHSDLDSGAFLTAIATAVADSLAGISSNPSSSNSGPTSSVEPTSGNGPNEPNLVVDPPVSARSDTASSVGSLSPAETPLRASGVVSPKRPSPWSSESDSQLQALLRLTQCAARLLGTLSKYSTAREVLTKERVVSLLLQTLQLQMEQDYIAAVSDCAVLAGFITKAVIVENGLTLKLLLSDLFSDNVTPWSQFHELGLIECISNWSTVPLTYPTVIGDVTPYLKVYSYGHDLWNDGWTFESFRTNFKCAGPGRHVYEVLLRTEGIIQIGWANENVVFDPEGGTGVGDDSNSYAFDGHRQKKWHGMDPTDNHYGEAWAPGDTITALLDLILGQVKFYRNGADMGVAFENVATDITWYPAISLASQQGCILYFGGALDKLKYIPEGYTPVAQMGTINLLPRSPIASADSEGDELVGRHTQFMLEDCESKHYKQQSLYELAPEPSEAMQETIPVARPVEDDALPQSAQTGSRKSSLASETEFCLKKMQIVVNPIFDSSDSTLMQVGFMHPKSTQKYVLDLHSRLTRIVSSPFVLSDDGDGIKNENPQVLATVSQVIQAGDVVSFKEVKNEDGNASGIYVQFVVNWSDFGPPIRLEDAFVLGDFVYLPYVCNVAFRISP
ncbi:hypothetical protein SeLEV6574_g03655 [Synchytrium endobioticum]|uniref:B30.2/SPRY domain-containing protein n=1 Tax=Synchytrium endobioticum TaxID=286115 RepID=A0A507D2U5_9FUNG|nr:hypothetical protein SeLEV6574_g03655 [Synchytrium endobioticum]